MLSTRASENIANPDHWAPLIKALDRPWSEENPDGMVILGIAENTLLHGEIAQHITDSFDVDPQTQLTYGIGPQGSRRLRTALSGFFDDRFAPRQPTDADEFIITSGVSGMTDAFTWCVCNEGEGLLLPQPVYTGFRNDIVTRSRGKLVTVSFARDDGDVVFDDLFDAAANVRCFERALQDSERNRVKIRGVIVTNPQNPLGKCYPVETLRAIAAFCGKHGLHYFSDEIYANSVFENEVYPDAVGFNSALSIDFGDVISPDLMHIMYGAAKDFCANGLRLGAFHTMNSALKAAMLSIKSSDPGNTFAWEAYVVQDIWARILEDRSFLDWYLAENQRRLAKSYRLLTGFLDEQEIPYLRGSNAGIFLWVDLRQYFVPEPTQTFDMFKLSSPQYEQCKAKETLISEACLSKGVMVAKGSNFLSEELGWFRITFTATEKVLMIGLQRMMEALKELQGSGQLADEGK